MFHTIKLNSYVLVHTLLSSMYMYQYKCKIVTEKLQLRNLQHLNKTTLCSLNWLQKYEPAAKSQLKKIHKIWMREGYKVAEKFKKEEEDAVKRAKNLEEAKAILIKEDVSLPKAKVIKIVDGKENRGSRVKINGWVHRLRRQGISYFWKFVSISVKFIPLSNFGVSVMHAHLYETLHFKHLHSYNVQYSVLLITQAKCCDFFFILCRKP